MTTTPTPKFVSIPQILLQMDGTPIPAFKGTVKAQFKRSTGEGQYGAWSLEPIVVTDGTNELRVLIKNRPPMGAIKGRVLQFCSVPDKKTKGWFGLKLQKGEYEGQERSEVLVNSRAIVTSAGQGAVNPQVGGGAPASAHVIDAKEADRRIFQLAYLWRRCWEATLYHTKDAVGMTPEAMQGCATFCAIAMEDAQLHTGYPKSLKEMPAHAKPAEPEPPADAFAGPDDPGDDMLPDEQAEDPFAAPDEGGTPWD